MKQILVTCAALLLGGSLTFAQRLTSPNGKVAVEYEDGEYELTYRGEDILTIPSAGILTAQHSTPAKFKAMGKKTKLKVDYQMLQGKRLHCTNRATEAVFHYEYADGTPLRLVMRVFDNGIAFRYELSGLHDDRLKDELTAFELEDDTRRWIQKW